MHIIIDEIDLIAVIKKSIYEYKDYGFAILGFYGRTIFYKYFFVGKKYYQGSKFFQNKKDGEIKK
jgi:hypothetical protein